MPKMMKITNTELTVDEIKERAETPSPFQTRWKIIYEVASNRRATIDIATDLGISTQYVRMTVCGYNREGDSFLENNRTEKRRTHAYLSRKEEQAFLQHFAQKFQQHEQITPALIQNKLEQQLQQKITRQMIYQMLERNGWKHSWMPPEESLRKIK